VKHKKVTTLYFMELQVAAKYPILNTCPYRESILTKSGKAPSAGHIVYTIQPYAAFTHVFP
jgi:hypothetical protein